MSRVGEPADEPGMRIRIDLKNGRRAVMVLACERDEPRETLGGNLAGALANGAAVRCVDFDPFSGNIPTGLFDERH